MTPESAAPEAAATKAATTKAASPTGDPWLLTPGPLTTSPSVKHAMLHDYGSRDAHFVALNRAVRRRLVELVGGGDDYVCVPLQGSGTFVVEAMLGCFVPRGGKLLLLVNGAYGERMDKICRYLGREVVRLDWLENHPVDPKAVEAALAEDPAIGHVAAVHCETTSGILNPIEQIAAVTARYGRRLLIDSRSAFGALPLDAFETPFDAVVASSNKCLEGVPGMGFCIARRSALEETKGNAPSLSFDLLDQLTAMEKTAQWRFTPPVQVIAAFKQALDEHEAEGGVEGRGARYRENCRILVDGMRALGFRTLLPDRLQAPIIVTFRMPSDPAFVFQEFYDRLRDRGFVVYPGKLTVAPSFRVGCIGRLGSEQMHGAVEAVRTTLEEMGVANLAPAAA